ncbi:hypothetical protein TRICI_004940 [Trichomonascus ciferrii]|uniref:Cytosolic Fe-S cluster assembly factor NAR1 n=1 Tax=Trichomonascus ciferrii TaxID=44093 RepID=A0A642UY24_9ASCO|nr:hypothetical protein TRICI_004940 [Trichomonascus ciferrii]
MSTILSSDDLNDFISPGVACIKPVEVHKEQEQAGEIEIGKDGNEAFEVTKDGEKQSLKAAQINLSDCLACSGCITSAESVLISLQSHNELLNALREEGSKDKLFVVSISHQVRASLAVGYNLSVEEVDQRLKHLFIRTLGFKYVVGLEIGRGIALEYGAEEVIQKDSGPVLSSSCPGWTCYVEKTHAHVIPYLSGVKSPQQITGTLIKNLISEEHGITQDKIYHLSLMPCFDKKLEAARPEFGTEEIRDVDCVITTKEVVQMLIDENNPFEEISPDTEISDSDVAPSKWPYQDQWYSHEGTSSGGYLNYVLREMQRRMDEKSHIEILPGKNADIMEYQVVRDSDGAVIKRAGQVYGFRNIQNLVRKLKMKQRTKNAKVTSTKSASSPKASDPSQWDYVEVMACPGGCVNGGGQIGKPTDQTSKEWKDLLEQKYQSIAQQDIQKQKVIGWVQQLWPNNDNDRLLKTTFNAVESDVSTNPAIQIGTKW